MILKLRTSRTFKVACVALALNIFVELVLPRGAFALTGGPAQPEFSSFTPIGTSDMVNLSSGDMSYNIPLLDVGGYPINIAYSAGVGMDQEASWVGLGWNLSVGQINRNVRGLPDDFDGDVMTYENYTKPNVTVGASFKFTPALVGFELDGLGNVVDASTYEAGNLTIGISAMYNNYSGFSLKPSVGIQADLGNNLSVGFTAESGPDGLNLSPNLSVHKEHTNKKNRTNKLGLNFGVSMNSRQGLTSTSLSASRTSVAKATKKGKYAYKGRGGMKGGPSVGSTIGYTDQVYTPQKRVGMVSGSFTFNAALGAELFGGEGQGQINAYGTVSKVKDAEKNKSVKAYGYCNTESADQYSVLDFNREKDGAFSKNTTNIPLTNYTYDIYSVQGQGVSGTFRPFRNQVGYVYDTKVKDGSFSGSLGIELGSGNAFHLGIDIEAVLVQSHTGVWENGNAILNKLKEQDYNDPNYEKVHFKNVGDLSVDRDYSMFDQVGGYQPIRVPFVGSKFHRTAQSKFHKKYDGAGNESVIGVGSKIKRTKRQLRNQAIYNLTKGDVEDGIGYGPLATSPAEYTLPAEAKDHHTAEIQVIRNDGARYIYGLGVYNTKKREATFAVDTPGDCSTGLVSYDPSELLNPKLLPNDKYFNRTTTPGYVHTHLLTSVLSTDYQDVSGDGPSTDDLGSYTKFSYVKKNSKYKWRVPYQEDMASYNEGLKTDSKDDQGNYVYGEKEQYYIDKIETKTHVAIFHYSIRKDAKGVQGEQGGIDPNQHSYKLDKISLYSIEEYDGLGVNSLSTAIKHVNFEYSYSLCTGVPNNAGGAATGNEISNLGGKLTLKKVYFTYRNSLMGKYTGYRFNYGEYAPVDPGTGVWYNPDEYSPGSPALSVNSTYTSGQPLSGLNPVYNIKGYDYWGNYLPNAASCGNTDPISAAEYSFTSQDKTIQDNRSAVWSMNKISLPSGGNISINYESDDYGYVQDKDVLRMYKIAGAGNGPVGTASDVSLSDKGASLFGNGIWNKPSLYLYVEIDDGATDSGADEIVHIDKYMKGLRTAPIYFRFLMNTTMAGGEVGAESYGKFDYVTGYFQYEPNNTTGDYEGDCDIFTANGGKKYLSIPVKLVDKEGGFFSGGDDVHPISKASWQFCRKYLSKHSFSSQPNGDSEDIEAAIIDLLSPTTLSNLFEFFTGPNGALENKRVGRRFIKDKSWIRLNDLDGKKLGGGCRVKEIRMSDIWEEMNPGLGDYQTMTYGQKYEYLTESGTTSGVAAYEPVGNKENPFVQPVMSTVEHILAPDEENFIERPFGESFFPGASVTYSRVSVSNLAEGEAPVAGYEVKKLHKTGSVVSEFYTTKDYPTIVDQTKLQAEEDDRKLLNSILALNVKKHFTASQGYVIHVNDMDGKEKAQRVFAEGQSQAISGADYLYDGYSTDPSYTAATYADRNKGKLNNNVRVINPDGSIEIKTIGVETDIVHDFRESKSKTKIMGINGNLATFFVGIIPGLVPMLLPDYAQSEDQFRSVGTTKVINTFGILKETVAYDAGAAVYTRNLAWDASTGEVLVTETVDEYNDKYFTFNYPAHWFYKGMAQASANLGLEGNLSDLGGGVFAMNSISPYQVSDFLVEADQIYLSVSDQMAWVSEVNGNTFKIIDEAGAQLTGLSGDFEVVRSGHRNLQSAGIMNATLMRNPLTDGAGNYVSNLGTSFLASNNWVDWKIINAGAVDYSDDWTVSCECGINPGEADPNGYYNPYRINEKGVWRTKSSRTYLAGRNYQADLTPRMEGFYTKFSPMYTLSGSGNWYKNYSNWTFVAEVSKYSPYGFELENTDALSRYSAAQYGYNNSFPMAVGANTEYRQIGFDGFEDYGFDGCAINAHFNFKEVINPSTDISEEESHTGRHSLIVGGNSIVTLIKAIDCP